MACTHSVLQNPHIIWSVWWMNGVLGHLCADIGKTGQREPPEDGEMSEMTLPSRHSIRYSSPDGLRPSTLPQRGLLTILHIYDWVEKKLLFLRNLNTWPGGEPAISGSPGTQLYPLHQGPRRGIHNLFVEFYILGCHKICKRCLFECDMGKYSTRPMNKVGEHLIHWTSAVFFNIAQKMNTVCIFSHDQVTYDIAAIDSSWTTARVWYGLIPIYVS